MLHVYYDGGPLAGLTSSLTYLITPRPDELERADMPRWPKMAYWRRLAAGVKVELDGEVEELAIGTFRRGSLYLPSVVACTEDASTAEQKVQAQLAVQSLRHCAGVVLVYRSHNTNPLVVGVDQLRADFARIGRQLEDVPVVLQATFQDADWSELLTPADLGAAVGIPSRLCVPSIATKGNGVREALSVLLKEIRSRAGAAS